MACELMEEESKRYPEERRHREFEHELLAQLGGGETAEADQGHDPVHAEERQGQPHPPELPSCRRYKQHGQEGDPQ